MGEDLDVPGERRRSTGPAVALLLMSLGYAVFAQGGFCAGRFRWLLVLPRGCLRPPLAE